MPPRTARDTTTLAPAGALPKGWRWATLGEVCRVASGGTPKTSVESLWGGEIVWITPTDLGRLPSRDIRSSSRRLTESGLSSSAAELLPPGAVVMSSRAPIGHLGIARVPLCTNQGCKSFVPDVTQVDSEFLYYVLRHQKGNIQALGSGATFPEVSKGTLEVFEVPLPPLPEQRRIAAILTEQLDAVERARKLAEEQLAAARALPAAYLREVFESEEAKAWPVRSFGDIITDTRNGLYKPEEFYGSGTPILKMFNIGRLDGTWNLERVDRIELTPAEQKDYYLDEGDILLNRVNSRELVAKCAVIDERTRGSVFESKNIRIRLRRDVADPFFISLSLNGPGIRHQIDGALKQIVGQATVNRGDLDSLSLPLPSFERQREIGSMVAAKRRTAELLALGIEAKLAMIDRLPSALLRAAFSGNL